MKCLEPCKVRLENKFNYSVFKWYQSHCDLRLLFFFSMASLSASTSIVNTTTSPSRTSHTTIHYLITIKLPHDNYLVWKAQIVPYLKGQHLYGYLNGTTPTPSQIIIVAADGATQALQNPEFHYWHLQDQMILSAIIYLLSL